MVINKNILYFYIFIFFNSLIDSLTLNIFKNALFLLKEETFVDKTEKEDFLSIINSTIKRFLSNKINSNIIIKKSIMEENNYLIKLSN